MKETTAKAIISAAFVTLIVAGVIFNVYQTNIELREQIAAQALHISNLKNELSQIRGQLSDQRVQNGILEAKQKEREKQAVERYTKLDPTKLHIICDQDVQYSDGRATLGGWRARTAEGLSIGQYVGYAYRDEYRGKPINSCKELLERFGVTGTIVEPSAQQLLDAVNQPAPAGSLAIPQYNTTLECTNSRCPPGIVWVKPKQPAPKAESKNNGFLGLDNRMTLECSPGKCPGMPLIIGKQPLTPPRKDTP